MDPVSPLSALRQEAERLLAEIPESYSVEMLENAIRLELLGHGWDRSVVAWLAASVRIGRQFLTAFDATLEDTNRP